jgi:FixJ family two-component response regulator
MTETDAMVFVVDDDAPMRESLKNPLRSVGLRAELFASGTSETTVKFTAIR